MPQEARKKIILFNNSDAHFYHHLMPLAELAKTQNYEVIIITSGSNYLEKIRQKGLRVINLKLQRKSINPLSELQNIISLAKIIKKEKPHILQSFTLKPILYCSIIGTCLGTKRIINTFLGMGFVFINKTLKARAVKWFFIIILRLLKIMNSKIIYVTQNAEDKKHLIECKISSSENIKVLCSVGIDPNQYPCQMRANKSEEVIFAVISRMLIDKGIREFVAAAEKLLTRHPDCEFWLVGSPDADNIATLQESELRQYHKKGIVKYLGYQEDLVKILQKVDVVVLPSYREGLSRSLLEAAACGKTIVTTDNSGGLELITNNKNGLLVPARDAGALEEAMHRLIMDSDLRERLAINAQQHVLNNYNSAYLALKNSKLWALN